MSEQKLDLIKFITKYFLNIKVQKYSNDELNDIQSYLNIIYNYTVHPFTPYAKKAIHLYMNNIYMELLAQNSEQVQYAPDLFVNKNITIKNKKLMIDNCLLNIKIKKVSTKQKFFKFINLLMELNSFFKKTALDSTASGGFETIKILYEFFYKNKEFLDQHATFKNQSKEKLKYMLSQPEKEYQDFGKKYMKELFDEIVETEYDKIEKEFVQIEKELDVVQSKSDEPTKENSIPERAKLLIVKPIEKKVVKSDVEAIKERITRCFEKDDALNVENIQKIKSCIDSVNVENIQKIKSCIEKYDALDVENIQKIKSFIEIDVPTVEEIEKELQPRRSERLRGKPKLCYREQD